MPRPSTLENPFVPEKHRSADDPKFVGKILGAEAEAAMRRTVADKAERAEDADQKGDLELTSEQRAKRAEEKEQREAPERARRELLAWADEIGKDEAWVEKTFIIHTDGTLTVERNLDLSGLSSVTRFPKQLTIHGDLDLRDTKITVFDGFPPKGNIKGEILLAGRSNEFLDSPLALGHRAGIYEEFG